MWRYMLYDPSNDSCFVLELFRSYSEAENAIDARWNDILIVPVDIPWPDDEEIEDGE